MNLLQISNPVLRAFANNSAGPRQTMDTTTSLIVLGGIVLGIFLLVIINNIRSKNPGGVSLRKLCRQHGLDRTQFQLLKKSVARVKLTNPTMMFNSARFMNAFLRKIFSVIENSPMNPAQKETMKGEFFEIRRLVLLHHQSNNPTFPSTKNIPLNQNVRILSKNFPPFPSSVTGKTSEFLILDHPVDGHGELVRYAAGAPIKIRFQRDADKIFTFVSSIADLRQVEGVFKILINHTNKIQKVQLRQAPRKEFNRKSYYYPVELQTTGKGRKAITKALVNRQRRYSGTFLDISSGGCGLIVRTALAKGSPLMISFDLERDLTVEILGKVRNVRKQRNGTLLMNIAFTRIDQKTLNHINTYVYGLYEEETRTSSILTKPLMD